MTANMTRSFDKYGMLRKPFKKSYFVRQKKCSWKWGECSKWWENMLLDFDMFCVKLSWSRKKDIIFVPWMDGFTGGYIEGWQRIYLDRNCYRTPLNDKQRESVLQTWIKSQMSEEKYTSKQRSKYTRYKNVHECGAQLQYLEQLMISTEASVLQTWFES